MQQKHLRHQSVHILATKCGDVLVHNRDVFPVQKASLFQANVAIAHRLRSIPISELQPTIFLCCGVVFACRAVGRRAGMSLSAIFGN